MKHIFTKLLSIFCTSPACALKQEAYAIMSPDGTTLTFYYDNKKASRQGTAYEINAEDSIPKWVKFDEYSTPENPNFTTVVFDESFKDARPVSCAYWFAGFRKLTKIEGINNLNTSNVTNMSWMFRHCERLTNLDLSNFNTSKVRNMGAMLGVCKNLTTLDVRNFDTSNVTNMSDMFAWCESLTNIDVRNFNTSKVTNMQGMFAWCKSLTNIDVRKFNTSNVTDMGAMFALCQSLTNLDISNFETSKVTDMGAMFCNCICLTELDVSKFNTSTVRDMSAMFGGCKELKTIYAGDGWNINKKFSEGMFVNCPNLVGGKGTKFNSEITDKTRAKIDGGKANPGYFTAKK